MLKGVLVNHTKHQKWSNYLRYQRKLDLIVAKKLNLNSKQTYACVLIKDEDMKRLNAQHRNKDYVTDVISFAALDQPMVSGANDIELGDVFINVDALERQAQSYGHSLKREFCFLLVHGILHLLQYDHQNENDEHRMFQLQEDILHDIAPRA
jgi:probable rRNA maturation factor